MTPTKETLREEHEELLPEIEAIRELADALDEMPVRDLARRLDEVHDFLAHRLIPHAVAEGQMMYPMIRQESGGPEVTVRMNRCHVELGRYTDELERIRKGLKGDELTRSQARELRRVLYGLHAVVKGHMEEEEEVYAETLQGALSREAASELLDAMERAEREIRSLYE